MESADTNEEIRALIGNKVYDEFIPTHPIVNHDSEGCGMRNARRDRISQILTLPRAFQTAAVHLMMHDEAIPE